MLSFLFLFCQVYALSGCVRRFLCRHSSFCIPVGNWTSQFALGHCKPPLDLKTNRKWMRHGKVQFAKQSFPFLRQHTHYPAAFLPSFVFQISRKFVFGYSSQIPKAILLRLELLLSCTVQRGRRSVLERKAIGHHFSFAPHYSSHHSIWTFTKIRSDRLDEWTSLMHQPFKRHFD